MGLSAASKKLLRRTGGAIKKARASYRKAFEEGERKRPEVMKIKEMMKHGYRP